MASYIYCWIRKDLPKVQQIIQMSHACYEGAVADTISKISSGLPESTPNMCLFEVKDENELISVSNYLNSVKIKYSMFEEPDFGHEFTSICSEIIETEEKRELFQDFKLYK